MTVQKEITIVCPKCDAAFILSHSQSYCPKEHKCASCGTSIPIPQPTIPNDQPAPPQISQANSIGRNGTPPTLPVSASSVSAVNIVQMSVPKTSNLAVASMVLGVLGIMGGWMCSGLILPLLAIVFGHISYSNISRQPLALSGKGMAIAGFTLGYVGLLFGLSVFFVLGTATASMAAIVQELAKQFPQVVPKP